MSARVAEPFHYTVGGLRLRQKCFAEVRRIDGQQRKVGDNDRQPKRRPAARFRQAVQATTTAMSTLWGTEDYLHILMHMICIVL